VSKSFGSVPFVFCFVISAGGVEEALHTRPFFVHSKHPSAGRPGGAPAGKDKGGAKPRGPPACRPFCAAPTGLEARVNELLGPQGPCGSTAAASADAGGGKQDLDARAAKRAALSATAPLHGSCVTPVPVTLPLPAPTMPGFGFASTSATWTTPVHVPNLSRLWADVPCSRLGGARESECDGRVDEDQGRKVDWEGGVPVPRGAPRDLPVASARGAFLGYLEADALSLFDEPFDEDLLLFGLENGLDAPNAAALLSRRPGDGGLYG
jgi:hypothetical protein